MSDLILGFDTSAAHCAAALLQAGPDGPPRLLACRAEEMTRGQAERLFPLLEEVLAEGGADWAALSAIGVGTGPGNFTGIRISVSAARGLALSLGIPALGVSSFVAAAHQRAMNGAQDGAPRGTVLATVPGPRDQVYAQRIDARGAALDTPQLLAAEALEAHAPELPRAARPEPAALAAAIARCAAAREGTQVPAAPVYVRPPDAAPPRDPAPRILPG